MKVRRPPLKTRVRVALIMSMSLAAELTLTLLSILLFWVPGVRDSLLSAATKLTDRRLNRVRRAYNADQNLYTVFRKS